MIIFDTSVMSELIRPKPAPEVKEWLWEQRDEDLATTAVTIAEIEQQLYRLPEGKRRNDFNDRLVQLIASKLTLPVLPFDDLAARVYPICSNARKNAGLRRDVADLMITAIAHSKEAMIATRSVRDFEATGIQVVNPWKS